MRERVYYSGRTDNMLGWRIFPPISNFTGCILRLKRRTTTSLAYFHLSVPQQTKVVDPQALVALFRQFLSEQEKHQRTPALEFIVLLILQQLTRDARLDEQADGAGTTLARKAQKLIRTQYHRPLSTVLLARELYCNADYLGRVYRRVFHLTLTEAIHRQRVREAEKLLISEARSLTEVAALCGFNDVGYFRQIFRKHTGLTPAAWKRRYSKEHINS